MRNKLNYNEYKILMSELINKSDFMTFNIPNYDKVIVFDECDDCSDVDNIPDLSDDFIEYRSKCLNMIINIQNEVIEVFNNTKYCSQSYVYELEIYVVKISDAVKKFCYLKIFLK